MTHAPIPERFRPWFRASHPGDADLLAPYLDPDEIREIHELSVFPSPRAALRASYENSLPHFRFTLWDDDALPGLPLAMGGLCAPNILWILRREDALTVSRPARRFFAGPDARAVLDWWGSLAPHVRVFVNRIGPWNTRCHRWLARLGAELRILEVFSCYEQNHIPPSLWFVLPNPQYRPSDEKKEGGRV